MTALSDALRDFYERKGGRIFFQNGMSLNQLALEMWERLGYQEIDPSVISRVLNGQRLFTSKQLEIFLSLFYTSPTQKRKASNSLAEDYLKRFGLNLDFNLNTNFITKNIIETLINSTQGIEQMRAYGNREMVQNYTDILTEITENLCKYPLLSDALRTQLYNILGLLLSEKGLSVIDSSLSKGIFNKIDPIMNNFKQISKFVSDKDVVGRMLLIQGGSMRITGHRSNSKKIKKQCYEKGLKYCEEGLNFVNNLQTKFRLTKSAILNAGDSENDYFLKKSGEKIALRLIEKEGPKRPDLASYLLCNLAVAFTSTQKDRSWKLVKRSWDIYHKEVDKFNPWLESRLIYLTLGAMVKLKHRDFDYASKLIERTRTISSLGFERQSYFAYKNFDLLQNLQG